MKYRLLNILACPICKHFPLELYVIERKRYERDVKVEIPACDLYCGFKGKYVKELKEHECIECLKYEVVTGVLYCPNCGRWYPIIDEIPRMLPDNYRSRSEDLNFLKKYRDELPEKIVHEGKPYNLESE